MTTTFIYAVKVQGDDIYIGGSFEMVDTVRARNIVRWNRVTRRWYPLGEGTDAAVNAIQINGDELFAGGRFSMAGGVAADRIARDRSRSVPARRVTLFSALRRRQPARSSTRSKSATMPR
jgi:hypothetical protein